MHSYSLNERPSEVGLAVGILWSSFILGIVASLVFLYSFSISNSQSILFPLAVVFLGYGLYAYLISKISNGKNWARICLLVFGLIGICSTAFHLSTFFSGSIFRDAVKILQYFMQLAAMAALFAPNSNRWFD